MTNFLISSAGRRGALTKILQQVARSNGGGKVIAVDSSPLSAAGQLADAFELVPAIRENEFIPAIQDVCKRHQVDVLVPTIDTELKKYADNRDDFLKSGIDVWVSSPNVIDISFDKWALHTWLTNHGVPTVKTYEVTNEQWHALSGRLIAKPRSGSSSIGVIRNATVNELRRRNLSADYIVQETAQGAELTVDFAVDRQGQFLGAVPRQRLEVRAGEVSKGRTVRSAAIERLVHDISSMLNGAYGVLNLQLFHDPESDDLRVIEINARFGGGYPLSFEAGADFPTLLCSEPQQYPSPVNWQSGLTMLRYDEAVFFGPDGTLK